ncbi:hypothetical protein [Stutzerimonas nitrititolerans]
MTFNTGNPVGSTDARDLNDNAVVLDEYINSPENVTHDRLGRLRLTLKGVENSAASAGPAIEAAQLAVVEANRAADAAVSSQAASESAASSAASEILAGLEPLVVQVENSANAAQSSAIRAETAAEIAQGVSGAVWAPTLTALNAITPTDQGVPGIVYGDTETINGYYVWDGVWTRSILQPVSEPVLRSRMSPIRFKNWYDNPSLSAYVPELRSGIPVLRPVINAFLNSRGATQGVYSTGTSSTALHVRVPIDPGHAGRYVIMTAVMSCNDGHEPVSSVDGRSLFLSDTGDVIESSATAYFLALGAGNFLFVTTGVIPAGTVALGIGGNLRTTAEGGPRVLTGFAYGIADEEIPLASFEWDSFRQPILGRSASAQAVKTLSTGTANRVPGGDFVGASPVFRTPVDGALMPSGPSHDYGLTNGIRWNAGNNYARAPRSAIHSNSVFGCFWVRTTNPANWPSRALLHTGNADGSGLTRPTAVDAGFVEMSQYDRIYWEIGILAAPGDYVFIGAATVPSDNERFASGFSIYEMQEPRDFSSGIERFLLEGLVRRGAVKLGGGSAVDGKGRVVLGAAGEVGYVEGSYSGTTVRREIIPNPIMDKTAPQACFNFLRDHIDGVEVRVGVDDVAPYRALGGTIGANHGWHMGQLVAAGHGKTAADIGSIFSQGDSQYVLVGIRSPDTLWLTRRADDADVPSGTFTRVSGGSSSDIVATAVSQVQWFPPFNNLKRSLTVDGVAVSNTGVNLTFSKEARFSESYDVQAKADIVEWLVARGGGDFVFPEAAPSFTVSNDYVFDAEGQCTIYSTFTALKEMPLKDIMFLQAQRSTALEYYIPKTLPFTHGGETVDYALKESASRTSSAGLPSVEFSPAVCVPTGQLADRAVAIGGGYYLALGFLPVGTASPDERREQITTKAMEIRGNTDKLYMSAVDKGATNLLPGESFGVVAYRNLRKKEGVRTCCYPVRSRAGDYLYVDYHGTTTLDRVELPSDYAGRPYSIVEKSENIEVLGGFTGGSVLLDVSTSSTYGYCILKFA